MTEDQQKYVRNLLSNNVTEKRRKLKLASEAPGLDSPSGRTRGAALTHRSKARRDLDVAREVLAAWNKDCG